MWIIDHECGHDLALHRGDVFFSRTVKLGLGDVFLSLVPVGQQIDECDQFGAHRASAPAKHMGHGTW